MNFSAIIGGAGSGKSTLMRNRARESGQSIKLCATTGIAALNLGPGVTTLNSLFGFYDEVSLLEKIKYGSFRKRVFELVGQYDTIAIDEISMLSASMLDLLVKSLENWESEYNQDFPDLMAIGDFCQLAPVNGNYAFEAKCWPRFAEYTTKLSGSYRQQGDPAFFDALQHARAGRGIDCVMALKRAGASTRIDVDQDFDGTTLMSINASVDKLNRARYDEISGVEYKFEPRKKGVQQSDWSAIPAVLKLKVGVKVMILANKKDRESGELEYVNGDCGEVVEIFENTLVNVCLDRNGEIVSVPFVTRTKHSQTAAGFDYAELNEKTGLYCVGYVAYLPVRLSYASSIHKSQGLTLNRVQIDARTRFAGEPGMMYTALSRCRDAKDLVIVTKSAGDFARRVATHPKVKGWV